jgi:hypothetical protein
LVDTKINFINFYFRLGFYRLFEFFLLHFVALRYYYWSIGSVFFFFLNKWNGVLDQLYSWMEPEFYMWRDKSMNDGSNLFLVRAKPNFKLKNTYIFKLIKKFKRKLKNQGGLV